MKIIKKHAFLMLTAVIFGIITLSAVLSGSVKQAFSALTSSEVRTVIIDAGHGGTDGGAVSASGYKESEINLEIALKTDALMAAYGINTVLTRESETIAYPEQADTIHKKKVYDQHSREELINSTDKAVLISIHQNNFGGKSAYGPQVLYGKVNGSMELASALQGMLTNTLCPNNKRVCEAISEDIYLFKTATCPSALVECGFLSNPSEEALLLTQAYQVKLAAAITAGYIQSLPIGDTNES